MALSEAVKLRETSILLASSRAKHFESSESLQVRSTYCWAPQHCSWLVMRSECDHHPDELTWYWACLLMDCSDLVPFF
jgi:hypothetical protein